MRPIVINNSIVLAWCLADEEHPAAERAMRLVVEHGAVVPGIWRYELWNTLTVNERRGRLAARETQQTLADLAEMRIEHDGDHDEARLLTLARQQSLSAYMPPIWRWRCDGICPSRRWTAALSMPRRRPM